MINSVPKSFSSQQRGCWWSSIKMTPRHLQRRWLHTLLYVYMVETLWRFDKSCQCYHTIGIHRNNGTLRVNCTHVMWASWRLRTPATRQFSTACSDQQQRKHIGPLWGLQRAMPFESFVRTDGCPSQKANNAEMIAGAKRTIYKFKADDTWSVEEMI